MPPVFRIYPSDDPLRRAIRLTWWHNQGVSAGEPGTLIGDHAYGGGRWNGPLTDAEIAAITAAGYGARVVEAANLGLLPSSLD
jgi:hypothetical protein